MNRFSYVRAEKIDDAVKALAADPKGKLIAGGTNLIDLMKYNVERPTCLIDVTRIANLSTIEETDAGGLRIGALVPNADVATDSRITSRYPLLASALLAGATPQLRNAASTGGNLNQRTRCYYFYDSGTPCNKREPGTGCPAIEGVNRIHAILGQSEHCIATHPSDMCVALAALEAVVHVTGPDGPRTIPMAEYHRLPGDRPEIDTTLAHDEIVTAVELPAKSAAFATNYTYLKLRDRLSYAFALVSVAVGLEIDGGVIRKAHIALGGVAHKPWRRPDAEDLIVGKSAGRDAFAAVAERLLEGARGYEHNAFKIELARRGIIRALTQAAAGNPQSQVDKRIR
ncbi:FAD binding domain-containing protein [Microvirga sp. P5_D2]